jgi:hypothetical protein
MYTQTHSHTQTHIHTHTHTHTIKHTHTCTHTISLTHTHTISHTQTHTQKHTHMHIQSLTHTISHTQTQTHTHTHTHNLTQTHSHTHSNTFTCIHTQTHSHIHTQTHSHNQKHTHTLKYTHTHTHTHTHKLCQSLQIATGLSFLPFASPSRALRCWRHRRHCASWAYDDRSPWVLLHHRCWTEITKKNRGFGEQQLGQTNLSPHLLLFSTFVSQAWYPSYVESCQHVEKLINVCGGSDPWSILYSFYKHICVAQRQLSWTAVALELSAVITRTPGTHAVLASLILDFFYLFLSLYSKAGIGN